MEPTNKPTMPENKQAVNIQELLAENLTLKQRNAHLEADIKTFTQGVTELLSAFQVKDETTGETTISMRKVSKLLMSFTTGAAVQLPGLDKLNPLFQKYLNQ